MDVLHAHEDERQNGRDLQDDHHVVGLGRLANAAYQHHRQQHDNQERGKIETEVPARRVKHIAAYPGQPARQVRRRDPAQIRMPAEPVEHVHQMRGEAHAYRHVADRIFQNQVPADDPCDQLTHGRVGVGIGAARDRDHGRQFGVTQRGEAAHDGHQHQRNCERRSCAGTAQSSQHDARCSRPAAR